VVGEAFRDEVFRRIRVEFNSSYGMMWRLSVSGALLVFAVFKRLDEQT